MPETSPQQGRLGILIVGCNGAVASTVIAGLDLIKQGISSPSGISSQTAHMPVDGTFISSGPLVWETVGLASLDEICCGGWDVSHMTLASAVQVHGVLDAVLQRHVVDSPQHTTFPGIVRKGDDLLLRGHNDTPLQSWREGLEAVQGHIRFFKEEQGCERVVVVCLLPTSRPPLEGAALTDPLAYERALEGTSKEITAAMIYLNAAINEDCGWANFTPNLAETSVLVQLAEDKGIPMVGRDGKTGQTLIKTVLAPAFRARDLKVRGWFSTNILGNLDGVALQDPESLKTKLKTKSGCLEHILGYSVGPEDKPGHLVTIHYHPPRGDEKEAWDAIDLEGFLGAPMAIKVNFMCRDSILAAPLVIDLARYIGRAHQAGERGLLPWLASYFKNPVLSEDRLEHAFDVQVQLLAKHIETWR